MNLGDLPTFRPWLKPCGAHTPVRVWRHATPRLVPQVRVRSVDANLGRVSVKPTCRISRNVGHAQDETVWRGANEVAGEGARATLTGFASRWRRFPGCLRRGAA